MPLCIRFPFPNTLRGKEKVEERIKLARKINIEGISAHAVNGIESLIEEEDINGAYERLVKVIRDAAPEVNKVKKNNQTWWNQECNDKRKKVTDLTNRARVVSCSRQTLKSLAIARAEFKQTVNECQLKHKQAEEEKCIREAEILPWKLNPRRNGKFSCPIPLENWSPHFKNLLNPPDSVANFEIEEAWLENGDLSEDLNKEFTLDEIGLCLNFAKDKKAVGCDLIANEHLKESFGRLGILWVMLFNLILRAGRIVETWKESRIKVLYKGKGDVLDTNAYRGIALLSHPFKLFTKILSGRILNVVENRSLPKEQFGFRRGRSTADALSVLRASVLETLEKPRTPLYAVFVDFSKAFDTVPRNLLIKKLVEMHGIRGSIVKVLASIYNSNVIRVDDGNALSHPIIQNRGVLQGDSLSPLMFILYTADLPERLSEGSDPEEVSVLCYADDLVMYSRNIKAVRRALVALHKYCLEFKLEVNVKKTKAVKFRRGGRLKLTDVLKYNKKKIEFVNSYEYLGVTVQTSWTFSKHLKLKKMKFLARMGSMRNLAGLSMSGADRYFNVMLKPIISYGINVIWEDLKSQHFKMIDMCKLLFFKRVMGLAKGVKNRFVILLMGDIPLLSESLSRNRTTLSNAGFYDYIKGVESKVMENVDPEFFNAPGMIQDNWKRSCETKRHLVTRASVHGFHHLICTNNDCFEALEECVCLHCNESASSLLHCVCCPAIPSLSFLDTLCS